MAKLDSWTHKALLALTVVSETTYDHPTTAGLKLRAYPNGLKTWLWLLVANKKRYKAKLGTFPAMTIKDAEAAAHLLNGKLANGEDPLVKPKAVERVTVREAWSEYLSVCKGRRTVAQRDRDAQKNFLNIIGDKYVNDVDQRDVRKCMKQVTDRNVGRKVKACTGGGTVANNVLLNIATFFNFCIKNRIDGCTWNPASVVDALEIEGSRPRRVLSVRELALAILAARKYDQDRGGDTTWADIITVLILVGNRKSEVTYAVGEEWYPADQQWVIPASRYKTKVEAVFCVGPTVAEIFDRRAVKGEFIFPDQRCVRMGSNRDALDRITALMAKIGGEPVEYWWTHALRHSFRTNIRKSRCCDSETAEKIIHPREPKNRISSRYDADFTEETSEALAKWDALIGAEVAKITAERMSLVA